MRPGSWRGGTGFTLIELTVVLVLVGVVFVVVFPNLSGLFSGRRLAGFAWQLAAALDYGRVRAVVEGRPQTFRINRRQREFTLVRPGRGSGASEEEVVKQWKVPKGMNIRQVELNTPVSEGFEPVIRFYPRGNSNGAVISLETDRGERAQVRVKVHTGRAEVTFK